MVADNFYGEDRNVKCGLRELKVPEVLALKPSHAWYHPEAVAGTLQDAAQEAGWVSPKHPGTWVRIARRFHDGSTQEWWAVEIVAGPYGPDKKARAIVASTDPKTLPDLSPWYLVTNLPAPTERPGREMPFPPASLEEGLRLSGLRLWVEQRDTHVKHALGWSQYQVRSDQAIRRHWQLVCGAFSFCWYHASHPSVSHAADHRPQPAEPEILPETDVSTEKGKWEKTISESTSMRPQVSWPMALRAVRAWLDPWIMLRRYWSGWSSLPPPPALQRLLHWLEQGQTVALYNSS